MKRYLILGFLISLSIFVVLMEMRLGEKLSDHTKNILAIKMILGSGQVFASYVIFYLSRYKKYKMLILSMIYLLFLIRGSNILWAQMTLLGLMLFFLMWSRNKEGVN